MLITPHVLTGSLTFKFFDRLFPGQLNVAPLRTLCVFFLAFMSHFVLDNIPHTEYDFTSPNLILGPLKLLFDGALAMFLLVRILNFSFTWQHVKKEWGTFVAGGLGILPDILARSAEISGIGIRFLDLHNNIHTKIKIGFWPGLCTQVVVAGLTGLLLYYYRKENDHVLRR